MEGLLAFVAVLVAVVLPAIISVVNALKLEVKKLLKPKGLQLPDLAVWAASVLVGICAAHFAAYVLTIYPVADIAIPPAGVTTGVGMILGLAASGLIDISKIQTLRT